MFKSLITIIADTDIDKQVYLRHDLMLHITARCEILFKIYILYKDTNCVIKCETTMAIPN